MTDRKTKTLTMALAQVAGVSGEGNWELVETAARDAAASTPRPDLLVLPECFLTGYYVENPGDLALQRSDAAGRLGRIAAAHGLAIVAGYIEMGDDGVVRNAAVAVDGDGRNLGSYIKRCLYGDWERSVFCPGSDSFVFCLRGWRIGVCICYDVEFPEVVRALAQAGAEAVVTPTALMAPDEEPVIRLLPARAVENGVFLAYANRVGGERELRYVGRSCVIDPQGKVLAKSEDDAEAQILATLEKPAGDGAPSQYLTDLGRLVAEK